MDDKSFKALEYAIRRKMIELSSLQDEYIKETGRCYIPGSAEAKTLKDNIKDLWIRG